MKQIILILMILISSLSSFSQSKKELKSNIAMLSLKVDALTAKNDANNIKLELLNDKAISLSEEVVKLQQTIDAMAAEIEQISVQTPDQITKSKPDNQNDPGKCKATTASGSACSRNAQAGSDYCWQHKKTSETKNNASAKSSSSGNSNSSYSGSQTIQTGPRGGKYYINSNGKKTYIKR